MATGGPTTGSNEPTTEDPSPRDCCEFVAKGLEYVNKRVLAAHLRCVSSGSVNVSSTIPRLVAVTKTKPVELVLHAYHHGQRHFGENYVQELVEKSQNPLLASLKDIRWHFVGHLQRNKCNNLVACPHLWAVETIDSQRLATALDRSWGMRKTKLNVFVQVNTSDEKSKHGSSSDDVVGLVQYIISDCNNLNLLGLMTIGKIGHDYSTGPNPDFQCLVEARKRVCLDLSLNQDGVELSMGMSADFEQAICVGSTNVRVGSVIFGVREPKKKP